ncbi:MAG: serine/threonine protein kinase, partial [Candidatus Obscuribacterales bacterium]|nr:serine/threonine protein kinase [Candidatus Obscuribacterales bacterium]
MLSGMDDSDSKGMVFADFRLGEKIGAGGMGSIYQAMQMSLQRPCAVKILTAAQSSDSEMRRFVKEARFACSLDHPNIAKVFSVGFDDQQRPYFAMELLKGQSLDKHIAARKIGIEEFRKIFLQVVDAIEYAHAKNIVHRDLKPANVFLLDDSDDDEHSLKLLDFGIARNVDESESPAQKLTRTGHLLGTPTYMSPEQSKSSSSDFRSDIYSLGVLMFETLTGQPPFQAESALDMMYKHSNEKVDASKLPSAPSYQRLNACILKCLEKNPVDRFQTAAELKVVLESSTTNLQNISARGAKDNTRFAIIIATVLLVIGSFTVFCYGFRQTNKSSPKVETQVMSNSKKEKSATLIYLGRNAQTKALELLRVNDQEGSVKQWNRARDYFLETIKVAKAKQKELREASSHLPGLTGERLNNSINNEHNYVYNAECALANMYASQGDVDNECKYLRQA